MNIVTVYYTRIVPLKVSCKYDGPLASPIITKRREKHYVITVGVVLIALIISKHVSFCTFTVPSTEFNYSNTLLHFCLYQRFISDHESANFDICLVNDITMNIITNVFRGLL